jgi:hypothetical protein
MKNEIFLGNKKKLVTIMSTMQCGGNGEVLSNKFSKQAKTAIYNVQCNNSGISISGKWL